MSVTETEITRWLIEDIETYPFKTRIKKEVRCDGGRADIVLPDYNNVIEAKGESGNVKHAIGQAAWYGETMDMTPYVLLPLDSITHQTKSVCEKASVGIVTTHERMLNFRIIHDVGGWESFNPKNMTIEESPKQPIESDDAHQEFIVGGI